MGRKEASENTAKEIPDNGHNETSWEDFKKQHRIPTISKINGGLEVYRQALRAYFETGNESCLDVVNHNLFEIRRDLTDKVLLGARQEAKG